MNNTFGLDIAEIHVATFSGPMPHFTADSSRMSVEGYGDGLAGMHLQSLSLVRFGEWPT